MIERMSIRLSRFFKRPVFSDSRFLFAIWALLPVIAWLTKLSPLKHNNFLIFRYSFWHALQQLPLYSGYPYEYKDLFLYGPTFSAIVAPFALPSAIIGLLLWLVTLSLTLYWALQNLDLPQRKRIVILWFCAHELLTALFMSQYNIAVASLIIGSFILIKKEKECFAALCIMLGAMTKIYVVVGFAFFFFVKHKLRFLLWTLVWGVVLFVLPMLISSPDYIIDQYGEWVQSLCSKNQRNMFDLMTNISFLGMVRKISGCASYSDIWLIMAGMIVLALPYLRFGQYRHEAFRLTILASLLMFVTLFSTGSESSSYIIPFTGVAIWYVAAPWKRSKWDIALMVFAFILTSMSPSDLFPRALRESIVRPYALKALPCFIIWLKLSYELCTHDYAPHKNKC